MVNSTMAVPSFINDSPTIRMVSLGGAPASFSKDTTATKIVHTVVSIRWLYSSVEIRSYSIYTVLYTTSLHMYCYYHHLPITTIYNAHMTNNITTNTSAHTSSILHIKYAKLVMIQRLLGYNNISSVQVVICTVDTAMV